MPTVYELSDAYIERLAALDPITATSLGVSGHDHELPDYSPDGLEAMDALHGEFVDGLDGAPIANERERVAREVMRDALALDREIYAAREPFRGLNILASPMQAIRSIFDLMDTSSEAASHDVVRRLGRVPEALASFRATLERGVELGLTASRRQTTECAAQAEVWSGAREGVPGYFQALVERLPEDASPVLRREAEAAAARAAEAYAAFGAFLRDEYLPHATASDACGPDRYQLHARGFNGIAVDAAETYAWGWHEIERVLGEMAAAAEQIAPGEGIEAAKEILETDPDRAIEGVEPFRRWMQDLQDRTIAELNGKHFDIPEPLQQIEAMIAPPGGALAMYYTAPTEDFSRPGRTWYPTGGKTRFPLWGEVSIAYHEGVPGHHLERGGTRLLGEQLSRYQRLLGGTSGYLEGWALYAERLMGELGYLENPDYAMGLLRSQALRSVRVIVDIGMHLELPIPAGQDFHPGERWTPELGLEFVRTRSHFPPDFVASEVTRYLGIPGQAISYKVGERVWLAAREAARRRLGDSFDLRAFHRDALNLGPMGLGLLERETARLGTNGEALE